MPAGFVGLSLARRTIQQAQTALKQAQTTGAPIPASVAQGPHGGSIYRLIQRTLPTVTTPKPTPVSVLPTTPAPPLSDPVTRIGGGGPTAGGPYAYTQDFVDANRDGVDDRNRPQNPVQGPSSSGLGPTTGGAGPSLSLSPLGGESGGLNTNRATTEVATAAAPAALAVAGDSVVPGLGTAARVMADLKGFDWKRWGPIVLVVVLGLWFAFRKRGG